MFLCHFCSETNETHKIKQSNKFCNKFLQHPSKIHFLWKKIESSLLNQTVLTLKRSESGSIVLTLFPKASWLVLAATASYLEIPSQSCASALPKVLGNGFCSQKLSKPSIVCWNLEQPLAGKGFLSNSDVSSAARPTSCKGFICSKNSEYTVWS